MLKLAMKTVRNILFISVVMVTLAYIIGLVISNNSQYILKDVLFVEGIILTFIGLFSMMSGNPSGVNLTGLGNQNGQYFSNINLEVTKIERQSTNFFKNFKMHSVFELAKSSVTVVVSGVCIILLSLVVK